jgi:hypothetical protein
MDHEVMSLLLRVGLVFAATLVTLIAYFGIQRALRSWVERDGQTSMPIAIRRQYGLLVRYGLAGVGAVHQQHRAAYRAFRRQVVIDSVIMPNTFLLVWLLLTALIDFRH